jgi:ABC-type polysaccharide/polyol phosphate export permease
VKKKLVSLYLLSYLEFKGKYKPMRIGVLWSLVRPTVQFLIFYSIFSYLYKTNITHAHYALELFFGLALWSFFSESTSSALNAISGRPNFVLNIYVPLLLLPTSSFIVALINLAMTMSVFGVLYLFSNLHPGPGWALSFAGGLGLIALLAYAMGVLLSIVNLFFRDIQQLWDLLLVYGVFLSPIIYYVSVPEELQPVYYAVNPFAFPLELAKSAFFPVTPRMGHNAPWLGGYLLAVAALTILALSVMKRFEGKARDQV